MRQAQPAIETEKDSLTPNEMDEIRRIISKADIPNTYTQTNNTVNNSKPKNDPLKIYCEIELNTFFTGELSTTGLNIFPHMTSFQSHDCINIIKPNWEIAIVKQEDYTMAKELGWLCSTRPHAPVIIIAITKK